MNEGLNKENNKVVKITKEMVLDKINNSKGTGLVQFPFNSDLSLVKDYLEFIENLENNKLYKVPTYVWIDKSQVETGIKIMQESGNRVCIKNPLFEE